MIDLDPGEAIAWDFVTETALAMRDLLKREVLLPEAMTHDAAPNYARRLAQDLADTRPKDYLLSSAPGARSRRIFLDYLRNGRGSTAAGAWSPRVRPGFPIARPVTWKQIENGIRPDAFTMQSPNTRRRG